MGTRLIVQNPKAQLLAELQAADLLLGCRGIPSDATIHRTRLHIKKARAALRLLSPSLRAKRYRKVQLALRNAGKTLRRARDSAVADETLARIARRTLHMKPAIQALEQSWRRHEDAGRAPLTPRDCRRVRIELGQAAALVRGLSLRWRDEELLPAVARTYRKAYHAYRRAARTQSKRAWHKCRKQTKYLYYQLAFTDASRKLRGTLQQTRVLESTLGKQRDLALLASDIRHRTVEASAGAAGVLEYLRNARERLQSRVDHHAVALFRTKPSAFAQQLQEHGGPIRSQMK
jgi:hypothetical protein